MDFVFNHEENTSIINNYVMDLKLENKSYIIRDDIHSLLLTSLFTDSRVNNQRGYWLPTESSGIWSFENDKRDETALSNIQEQVRLTLSRLKAKGFFQYFRIESSLEGNDIVINIFINKDNYKDTKDTNEYSFTL